MRKRISRGLLILLLLGAPVSAGAIQAEKQAGGAAGQARSQAELDDYNKLHKEIDPEAKKKLIGQFAATYPNSELLAYVYQEGSYLGRQSNDIEAMAAYGEKSLKLWPENFTLLTDLASVYVQRDGVDEAEEDAGRALDLIAVAEQPAGESESQWAATKKILSAINQTTLGYVHLRRAQAGLSQAVRSGEADAAILSFKRALDTRPIDDYIFYGLGFAYAVLNDYENAESNLAKAVAVNGLVMASARNLLEEVYRSRHNQSLDGLGEMIARAKADLGLL